MGWSSCAWSNRGASIPPLAAVITFCIVGKRGANVALPPRNHPFPVCSRDMIDPRPFPAPHVTSTVPVGTEMHCVLNRLSARRRGSPPMYPRLEALQYRHILHLPVAVRVSSFLSVHGFSHEMRIS